VFVGDIQGDFVIDDDSSILQRFVGEEMGDNE
jgi:hypothetical protein